MSAESGSDRARTPPARRSFAANVLFTAAFLVVAATALGGAFACVALLLKAADNSSLSALVPENGRIALVIGGIVVGGVTGMMVPLTVFAMAKGNEKEPRVGPVAAVRRILAVLVFSAYVLLVAFLVAQLGRFLPQSIVNIVGVFAVGFSWMPLAMLPWEKLGLGDVVGRRITTRVRPGSSQAE
ncbi:hypothetical protein OG241_21615 [Streptomyces sp. NBC_01390]|uniref:hypothetical protein n=1 Tax=Streptomyces sp. NBC_01390 TaxID=2903850 RepID=UPI0032456303